MKNIIFIAAPAAGKGTQCELLVEKYGYNHISTGNLLREKVAAGDKELDAMLKSGALVPDEIVFNILEEKLKTINGPIVLDGFPRTLNQCAMYHELCKKLNIPEGVVIFLEIDEELAMQRALGRITCPKCGRGYNKYSKQMAPKEENKCDDCHVELTSRSDDTEETFKNRFQTYMKNVTDILEYYKKLNILEMVSSHESKFDTFNDVEKLIEE